MSERSVVHATFVVERTYDAPPARVFAAWADPAIKRRWFTGPPEWETLEQESDFRIGGREHSRDQPPGGQVIAFDARYQDIVADRRIIYAYDMHLGDTRISVSLATIEFEPAGTGTRLILTEQGAYLDGHDTPAQREEGTGYLLDALGAELDRQSATA